MESNNFKFQWLRAELELTQKETGTFYRFCQTELAPSALLSQTPAWNQYLLQKENMAEKKLVKGQYFSTSKGHKLQVLHYHNVLVSQHIF